MKYDVIVVLAGGITANGSLPLNTQKRVLKAKELYDEKLASQILMSGRWSYHWKHHPPPQTEASLMVEFAQSLGIKKKVLFKEELSHNTKGNAFYIHQLFLEPKNWKKLLIITSDFHVIRVKKIFDRLLGKEYFVDVIGVPTDGSLWRKLQWRIKEYFFSVSQLFSK